MSVLTGVPLHFPEAREWMWDYCVYLGPWTDEKGKNYDLGIYVNPVTGKVSAAAVYGNQPGDYLSGALDPSSSRLHFELWYRAFILGIITHKWRKKNEHH